MPPTPTHSRLPLIPLAPLFSARAGAPTFNSAARKRPKLLGVVRIPRAAAAATFLGVLLLKRAIALARREVMRRALYALYASAAHARACASQDALDRLQSAA